jgi:gliotoxin biosynthesis N-methyltransferase
MSGRRIHLPNFSQRILKNNHRIARHIRAKSQVINMLTRYVNCFLCEQLKNIASKMADSQTTRDSYSGPRHEGEYIRLRVQHELVKINMDGKLVRAPIDLSKPDIKILDSATADGYWLVDLANTYSLAPTAQLVGADIASQHFTPIEERPANLELILQNIFDEWPAQYHNYFDLVHQRFVLPVCDDAKSVDAIAKLFACVKPGGYLQIHDGDMETIIEGPEHVAMAQFRDMMGKAWKTMGHNLSPGPKITGWLKEIEAKDIEETLVINKCGPLAEEEAQGERAISVLLALLDGAQALLGSKSFPKYPRYIEKGK